METKAKSIEIVSHCFCPPGVTQYAEHLIWQWASLTLYPPPVPTTLSVCFTGTDLETWQRLQTMQEMISEGRSDPAVSLQTVQMKPSQLFRRAIGRNWCAKRTKADVVWMTDVDYLFGPGCLTEIAKLVGPDSGLMQPGYMRINTTHDIGDKMVQGNLANDLPTIDTSLFSERKQRTCIGGCQIVGGDLARRIGYLDGTAWMEPVEDAKGFLSCRGDKKWRSSNNLKAKRLPFSVYRIRHNIDGRDFTLDGENKGKEVWK